jgi:hypothetical protein
VCDSLSPFGVPRGGLRRRAVAGHVFEHLRPVPGLFFALAEVFAFLPVTFSAIFRILMIMGGLQLASRDAITTLPHISYRRICHG